jgi:uncharacterized membrane protein
MVKQIIIPFVIVLGLFLILDVPVITWLNASMYQKQFKRINNGEIKLGISVWISAAIAYFLLALGIYLFIVRPEITNFKPDYLMIFMKGLALGLIIYGIYNGTNKATINEWGAFESLIDTVWGTLLNGILAISSVYLTKKII